MTTWVLLRGLSRGAGHWGSFPAELAERLPDARLVLPDLPGNGSRYRERSPANVAHFTAALRQDLRRQGLRPPYHLLALSLGAMVAADWALRQPEEVAGAVLINTSLQPFSPMHHRLRPTAGLKLLARAATAAPALQWEQTILALTSRTPGDPAATLRAWVQCRRAQPVSLANALRQLLAATRYRAPAAPPLPPLLLLASTRDALVNPACSRALARAWQAPLAEHPSAGHDLPLDAGPWVAGQVLQWLAATQPGCQPA